MIIVLGANYSTFLGSSKNVEQSNGTSTSLIVELGDIQNFIEVVGDAELVDEQSLSFNQAGTITKVNFKAGDTVKKGETIAKIDDSDAYDSIENAKISLENAKINLRQLYDDVDESKLIQSKNSILTSENSLENTKKELDNLKITQKNALDKSLENIDTSKKELEQSKSSLELSENDLEIIKKEKLNSLDNTKISKSTSVTNIEESFKTYSLQIEKIIEQSDYILGVTKENKSKNDSYETFLGAKDKVIKSNAKISLLLSISMYKKINLELENYSYDGDKDSIENILNLYLDIFNNLYNTVDLIYQTAENSITSVGSLDQSKIDSIKSSMNSYRSSSLSKVSSINSSIKTLNTLTDTDLLYDSNNSSILSKEKSIENSKLSIEKEVLSIDNAVKKYSETVASYKLIIEEKEQNIKNKEVSLEVSKLNLEELLEGPTSDNITKANNSIKQANIKLDSAYENLEDYILQAPFDGVIRKIDYMVGDNISNDTSKYIYIENPNLLEISVMLDQIDIVTVELGQEASITFDTYSTIAVKSKISSIDTTPVQSSGVISYEVKLILDDPNFDKKVISGMTANVEIITESKESILIIKTSALTEKDGKNYLTVEKAGKSIETEVEIGIASSGKTEIISGVNEGDTIIIKEFVANTTEEEGGTSLFGGGGGGNRSGPPGGF